LATAFLVAHAPGAESSAAPSVPKSEQHQGLAEAHELLKKGDEAYVAGRYSDAVVAYSGARDLIPDTPLNAELREAATERYAQASVEHGRELLRKGDLPGAKAAVEKVLAAGVDPENPGALSFRNQLNDPIRTNQAITAEHGKDVEAVRKLLYRAEGAFNLGKFDESSRTYQEVLRIDPTNSAARRGMEKVAAAKSDYFRAAYDQTRAEMLSQVEAEWEIKPPSDAQILAGGPQDPSSPLGVRVPVSNKIERIILPTVSLEQVTIEEAVDYLRAQAARYDTFENDPALKGVNFNLDLGPDSSETAANIRGKRFDLRLRNVPISQVLRYITESTQTAYTTDEFSVIIRSASQLGTEMVTRSFRVPPDFLSSLGNVTAGASADVGSEDPFGEAPTGSSGGLLAKRLGAKEALQGQGIQFPEGATANLNPATNTLMVRNTQANIDIISQLVETIAKTEPVQVMVTVTMIKVEENRFDELGFDWLLEGVNSGSKFNLTGGTQGSGGDLTDMPLPAGVPYRPVTAGNRSGSEAIQPDAIDTLIANAETGFAPIKRAPGVLSLTGMLSNNTYQMVMRGLAQKKGVDLMTAPSVITRSGQSASVRVVREFIYPTEYEPPEIPNSFGVSTDEIGEPISGGTGGAIPIVPAFPTEFKMREVGVMLDVLPTVDSQTGLVDLKVDPLVTNFDGFVNFGTPINAGINDALGNPQTIQIARNSILMPVFSVMRVKNEGISIHDGATVVFGGLIQETTQRVNDHTPVLGSLPGVGRLFKSEAQAPVKKVVVFMVNVKLMDPTGRPVSQR
jgi:general secretion pathway protein D